MPFRTPSSLAAIQVRPEYQINRSGGLVPFTGSNEQGRLTLYKHSEGYSWWFRHDLPSGLRSTLENLGPDECWNYPQRARKILELWSPCHGSFRGEACVFTESQPIRGREKVIRLPGAQTAWGLKSRGKVVASCVSVRENDEVAESWVWVEPSFRRRGLGKVVTQAWARDLLSRGKTPFYSYADYNTASRNLAKSLGLKPFAQVMGFD